MLERRRWFGQIEAWLHGRGVEGYFRVSLWQRKCLLWLTL